MRVVEQGARRIGFDLLAGVLHDHAIRRLGDDAHVVGDQHQRHAGAVLEVQQKIEDLRLHGDVERRGRFVGDQKFGRAGERHRDHHALAHAAGELMREGVQPPLGIGDADVAQQRERARPALGARRVRDASSAFPPIWKPTVKQGFSDDIGS